MPNQALFTDQFIWKAWANVLTMNSVHRVNIPRMGDICFLRPPPGFSLLSKPKKWPLSVHEKNRKPREDFFDSFLFNLIFWIEDSGWQRKTQWTVLIYRVIICTDKQLVAGVIWWQFVLFPPFTLPLIKPRLKYPG